MERGFRFKHKEAVGNDLTWFERRRAGTHGKRDGLRGLPAPDDFRPTPYLNELSALCRQESVEVESAAHERKTELEALRIELSDAAERCARDLPQLADDLACAKTRMRRADEARKHVEVTLWRRLAYYAVMVPLFAVEIPVNAYVLTILQLNREATFMLAAGLGLGLAALSHMAGKDAKKHGVMPDRYKAGFACASGALVIAAILRTQIVGADEIINEVMPALRTNPYVATAFFVLIQAVFLSVGYLLSRSSHAKDARADRVCGVELKQARVELRNAQEAFERCDKYQHSVSARLGKVDCELADLPAATSLRLRRIRARYERLAEHYKHGNLSHREDGSNPFARVGGAAAPVDIKKIISSN